MRYAVVAPQFGFEPDGSLLPGGLLQFGRCVVRALASCPQVERLGVFSQVDHAASAQDVRRMLRYHAHPALQLDVRCFGGNRSSLAFQVLSSSLRREYDRIMYLLVNQSVLSVLPFHLPYDVWEIGEELFHPVSALKERSLQRADRLLSISHNTAAEAARHIPGLEEAQVVHLCLEPPLFAPIQEGDPVLDVPYTPETRELAVLVVANMHASLLYKGHQQLIDAWPIVVSEVPQAELWLVGDGDGRSQLEARVQSLPASVAVCIGNSQLFAKHPALWESLPLGDIQTIRDNKSRCTQMQSHYSITFISIGTLQPGRAIQITTFNKRKIDGFLHGFLSQRPWQQCPMQGHNVWFVHSQTGACHRPCGMGKECVQDDQIVIFDHAPTGAHQVGRIKKGPGQSALERIVMDLHPVHIHRLTQWDIQGSIAVRIGSYNSQISPDPHQSLAQCRYCRDRSTVLISRLIVTGDIKYAHILNYDRVVNSSAFSKRRRKCSYWNICR